VSPADSVVPPVRIRRGGKAFSCFPSLFLRFQVLRFLSTPAGKMQHFSRQEPVKKGAPEAHSRLPNWKFSAMFKA